LKTYDPSRASLSTWLTLVARSVTIDRLRARRLSVHSLELGHVAQAPAAPASAADEGPDLPLHILTGRQRLVLRLLFDEGRTVTEAAAMLAVDEQTIRSTKHKALSRLREHFERESSAPIAGDAGRRDAV
jgi:RNA polymerase sigma-70 factor (ECF subfamily)